MSNLTQKTYQRIRNAIINGELKPGERLVEQEICQDFEVGRSPLREALRLLQMEGYVDLVPNKGVTISKISIKELGDIYDIVAVLEGFAAEASISHLKKADIKKLKSIQKALKKAGDARDFKEWINQNSMFHRCIVEACGNKELIKVARNFRDKIRRYRYMSIIAPGGNHERYLDAHEKIIESIAEGNAALAGSYLRNHVLESKELVIAFLKNFPEF